MTDGRAIAFSEREHEFTFAKNEHACAEHIIPVHSANLTLEAAKNQRISQQQLPVITYSIIISHIFYALPAWGGFLSVELKIELMPFQLIYKQS